MASSSLQRLAPIIAAHVMLGCGAGPLSIDTGPADEADEADATSNTATEESESETGLDPEVAAEIEQIPDELQQIVDGALAYFAVPEDGVLHLCPHPSASPAGGQTWPTPEFAVECWCEPGVTYDTIFWESPPWKMIGFAKTDRHLFHYNFRASNELEGYGAAPSPPKRLPTSTMTISSPPTSAAATSTRTAPSSRRCS